MELKESVQLSLVVDEVLSILLPLAAAKGIDLESDLSPELTLHADRVRLTQILYNVLSNAIKFTPQGTVRLIAGSDQKLTCISVIDTGIEYRVRNKTRYI